MSTNLNELVALGDKHLAQYTWFPALRVEVEGGSKKALAKLRKWLRLCEAIPACNSWPRCPDCGGPISRAKLKKGYHCSACTREADPAGYIAEVRGEYDYPDC